MLREVNAGQPAGVGVAEWQRHQMRAVDQWRIALMVCALVTYLLALYMVWHAPPLNAGWSFLLPYLAHQSVVAVTPTVTVDWCVYRAYSRASALLAAGPLGDESTRSSAIAAQGHFERNLTLADGQNTERNRQRPAAREYSG